MKLLRFLFTLVAISFVTTSYADSWKHTTLVLANEADPSDQIEVGIDNLFSWDVPDVAGISACPVFFNIQLDSQDNAQGARVVLNQYVYNSYGLTYKHYLTSYVRYGRHQARQDGSFVADLYRVDNKLTGELPNCLYSAGAGSGRYDPKGFYDIAVAIDGVWYKGLNGNNAMFQLQRFN